MKGTWIYDERLDNWHLKTGETTEEPAAAEGDPVLVRTTWCRMSFRGTAAPEKPGSQLSEWGDAVHDECYRKSEELE